MDSLNSFALLPLAHLRLMPPAPPPDTPPPDPGKARLFRVLMVLLPVLFFGLVEGTLRLAGYGDDYPLFVPVPGAEDYLMQNRDVARRYFSRQERVPTGLNDVFKAHPDSSTVRLFVQGGSSAAGYPYYFGGSFSRMLEQRLQQSYPHRTIEVVNTALAAVNSYTLLDFADEVIAQRPDAVLIYAGHNEFYGALGVGSAESLGRVRGVVNLYLGLRRLRLMQGLRAILERIAALRSSAPNGQPPGTTLMERMVGEQQIPLGSPLYRRGMAQFRGNLQDLLRRYRERGIPVFIGTVASNERTFPPFISGHAPGTDTTAWRRAYREGLRASREGQFPAATRALEQALHLDSLSAETHFARARILDTLGRFDAARIAYLAAKDRDELRFRASEDVNTIIREEAARAGATVVETQAALSAAARDGIIGSDLMLEHLHPNIDGYFVLSDAFYYALLDAKPFGAPEDTIPAGLARREILATAVDSLIGTYRLRQLMGSWPFQPPGVFDHSMDTVRARTPVEHLALDLYRRKTNWYDATTALRNHYAQAGRLHLALKAALALIQQYPFLPAPYAAAGDLLVRQHRYDEALPYFEAANDREESAGVHLMLGSIHLFRDRLADAVSHLQRSLALQPDNTETLLQLATAYYRQQKLQAARRTLEQLLRLDPGHTRAHLLLSRLPRPG